MSPSIAIIPARGGSKRLPRKNLLSLEGKPIIAWSIEAALESNIFDYVCVSTEDAEIAEVAEAYGANVLHRPKKLASDSASCAEVCHYHLSELESQNLFFDYLYCLYATAPLRNSSDLQQMKAIFCRNSDCNAVIATTGFTHNPFQAFVRDTQGKIKPFWPDLCRMRSSDFPPMCAGNGSTYAIKVSSFKEIEDFYSPQMRGVYCYEMPFKRSIDIDTQEDFLLLTSFLTSGLSSTSDV